MNGSKIASVMRLHLHLCGRACRACPFAIIYFVRPASHANQ
uniref:Uncharacterized protein n=1 Tax=Setaria italica TaxID=4555 RepID=K3Y3R1_SETIT